MTARNFWNLCLIGITSFSMTVAVARGDDPDSSLRVVIIRHGEKPSDGDNLSCKGLNRALALPPVLHKKFGVPNHAYVPSIDEGKSTKHVRMFQTIAPMAVKYNLTINTKFAETDTAGAAEEGMTKKKTVLMVWEHSQIPDLAKAFGVTDPKAQSWPGDDFDSIWIITYPQGKPVFSRDKEGIMPSDDCPF